MMVVNHDAFSTKFTVSGSLGFEYLTFGTNLPRLVLLV